MLVVPKDVLEKIEKVEADKNTNSLFGTPIATHSLTKTVQVRTHRKKRINKKWRKRYGFKEVPKNEIYMINDEYLSLNFKPMTPDFLSEESSFDYRMRFLSL